ncbi:MAG: hypothetical protein ABS76_07840 [Pelagibacterium sp. SCN 64-44]|nr:MAG: hypothetical protein ABS76_07840 [Pelagibacterium sp. SCN 64-44]
MSREGLVVRKTAIHRLLSVAIALIGLGASAILADECPAERALYGLETDEGPLEIGFLRSRNYASIASDLYLYLNTTQRTYWFTFSVSNGYSGMTLLPVTDPARSDAEPDGPRQLLDPANDDAGVQDAVRALRFYALDKDFTFWFEPPNEGEAAPTYVMIPEIGLALWYGADALTDDPAADRDPMPRGMFQRIACLDTIAPPAWP